MSFRYEISRPHLFVFRSLRKLYDWVLHWANTRYAVPALITLSFAESSFFPVPPDVLLLAMGLARPKKGVSYGILCTIFSVLGGMFGYLIGMELMQLVGYPILDFYGYRPQFEDIRAIYQKYDAWAVGIAALTPIPYKVFTIGAGAFDINFTVFCIASLLGRGLRFITIGWLIGRFGSPIKIFIDKYFNLLTILFVILLIGGFIVIKYVV